MNDYPEKFGRYARIRLESGAPLAPAVVSRARKPSQQTRPVPIVGIPERIAYRALCEQVMTGLAPADRSSEAYRKFISGPIKDAVPKGTYFNPRNSATKYVVESDITAFYEYIDHSRLLDELQLRTSTVDVPRYLVQLLTEVQARPFGLPQLLSSSDELSEVYGRIAERELRRRGVAVWRYNDDFRMTATTYEEAQANVEALAREASAIGLVLNERKTDIIKFTTYVIWNLVGGETEGDIEFKPESIKMSNDYGELDDEALAGVAHEIFDRFNPTLAENVSTKAPTPLHQSPLDPAKLSVDENRRVRHALNILTKLRDPCALDNVPQLFEFAPYLCHTLGSYLVELHKADTDIGPVWDEFAKRGRVFNAWQRMWLVHLARVCKLLEDDTRQGWVDDQRSDADPLLRAESTLAVAPHKNKKFFDDIDQAVRTEPEALLPWYALAARAIPNVNQTRLQALKESHKLIELLLLESLG